MYRAHPGSFSHLSSLLSSHIVISTVTEKSNLNSIELQMRGALAWECLSCHSLWTAKSCSPHESHRPLRYTLSDLEDDDEHSGDAGGALTTSPLNSLHSADPTRPSASSSPTSKRDAHTASLVPDDDDLVSQDAHSTAGLGLYSVSAAAGGYPVGLLPGRRQMRFCAPCGYIRCVELREVRVPEEVYSASHLTYSEGGDSGNLEAFYPPTGVSSPNPSPAARTGVGRLAALHETLGGEADDDDTLHLGNVLRYGSTGKDVVWGVARATANCATIVARIRSLLNQVANVNLNPLAPRLPTVPLEAIPSSLQTRET